MDKKHRLFRTSASNVNFGLPLHLVLPSSVTTSLLNLPSLYLQRHKHTSRKSPKTKAEEEILVDGVIVNVTSILQNLLDAITDLMHPETKSNMREEWNSIGKCLRNNKEDTR